MDAIYHPCHFLFIIANGQYVSVQPVGTVQQLRAVFFRLFQAGVCLMQQFIGESIRVLWLIYDISGNRSKNKSIFIDWSGGYAGISSMAFGVEGSFILQYGLSGGDVAGACIKKIIV